LKTLEKNPEDRHPDTLQRETMPEGRLNPAECEKRSQEVHGTVEFLMRRMNHKGDLPSFSKNIIEIHNKLSSLTAIDFSSAGDLARIILKDFSLTNKLLKIVNSALYPGLSGKVTTISKAMFLLGIEKVRVMAATLMIFEHLENKSQAKELKEVAFSSFMSGLVATGVAEKMKMTGKEEIFICAMLYNLGKMLVICYFPEEYEEIKKQILEGGLDETGASQSVLGISFNALGTAVARSWNFPDKIVDSMEPLSCHPIDRPKTTVENLRILSSYSNELLLDLINTPSSERAETISRMSKRYENGIPIPEEQMRSLLQSVVTKTNAYSDLVLTDKQTSDRFRTLFQSDRDSLPEEQPEEGIARSTDAVIPEGPTPDISLPDAAAAEPQSILTNGLREINEILKGRYRLNDVLYMILETMYRGFAVNRVIFCLRNVNQGTMAARFGLGENIDEMVRHFHFRINPSPDIFNIVIAQEKGILIDDAASPNILKIIPPWYRDLIAAPSFFIYPLISAKGCLGMLYADRKTTGPILTDIEKTFMEEFQKIFISAITSHS